MYYQLTEEDLESLEKYADQPIKELRKAASADEIKPQGIVEKWTRGRCLVELIESGWLGSPTE